MNVTELSTDIADLRQAIVYVFRSAGRLCRCDIVPYRDRTSGRFCCAILTPFGFQLRPRQVQQFAELVAREYFHKSPDSLTWMYIPCGIGKQTSVPDEVWQIQFTSKGSNSEADAVWSLTALEAAGDWSKRIVQAADFGSLIDVHE